jgi:hypothetical protein
LEETLKAKCGLFLAIGLVALTLGGCSFFAGLTDDVIVGSWQQSTVNGVTPLLVNVIKITDDKAYTTSTAGITTNTGSWSKSGSSYTFVGALFGFISTSSVITPTFTDSNNTMTYTDGNGYIEVYKK